MGRYQSLAERTGGIVSSVCLSDWARSVSKIAPTDFGLPLRFFLSSQPVINTIGV